MYPMARARHMYLASTAVLPPSRRGFGLPTWYRQTAWPEVRPGPTQQGAEGMGTPWAGVARRSVSRGLCTQQRKALPLRSITAQVQVQSVLCQCAHFAAGLRAADRLLR